MTSMTDIITMMASIYHQFSAVIMRFYVFQWFFYVLNIFLVLSLIVHVHGKKGD